MLIYPGKPQGTHLSIMQECRPDGAASARYLLRCTGLSASCGSEVYEHQAAIIHWLFGIRLSHLQQSSGGLHAALVHLLSAVVRYNFKHVKGFQPKQCWRCLGDATESKWWLVVCIMISRQVMQRETCLPLKEYCHEFVVLLPSCCSFALPHGLDGLVHEPVVI